MNYRHSYHAGNFADVLKHAVLVLCLDHLRHKATPFRVVDTHAGIALHDLGGREAEKTGEWRTGIGRLRSESADAMPDAMPEALAQLVGPYLDIVRSENPSGRLKVYPGSSLIAARMLRDGDRLVACELHPEDATSLTEAFRRDRRVKVMALDGWTGLKSLLPPKERRGLVLIDPPYELPGEIHRLAPALAEALARFATGIYVIWYPIKDPLEVDRALGAVAGLKVARLLQVELLIRAPRDAARLNGSGLLICNPPHTLEGRLAAGLDALTERLADGEGARWRLRWLSRTTP